MFLKYFLSVIGYGFSENYDDTAGVGFLTFKGCIEACSKKRKKSGNEWNDLHWGWSNGYCMCYMNGQGHEYWDGTLHYHFS